MYIYLDESYNLADRSKKQFISINGFSVLDEKTLFKKWNEYRRPFALKKRRIHATEKYFDKLRAKALQLVVKNDLTLNTVFQVIQKISFDRYKKYYHKAKLNFDAVYLDMLIELLKELHLGEYRNVTITIDSKKYKGGALGKTVFKEKILDSLNNKYKYTKFNLVLQPSTSNVLLELADFVSNIFYRAYITDDEKFFEDLQFMMIQLKNPLGK